MRYWGKIYSFFIVARKIDPFFAYLFLETDKMRIKPYRDRAIELESNLRYNVVPRTFLVRNQEEWSNPFWAESSL